MNDLIFYGFVKQVQDSIEAKKPQCEIESDLKGDLIQIIFASYCKDALYLGDEIFKPLAIAAYQNDPYFNRIVNTVFSRCVKFSNTILLKSNL